jgi:hypothetical protein
MQGGLEVLRTQAEKVGNRKAATASFLPEQLLLYLKVIF